MICDLIFVVPTFYVFRNFYDNHVVFSSLVAGFFFDMICDLISVAWNFYSMICGALFLICHKKFYGTIYALISYAPYFSMYAKICIALSVVVSSPLAEIFL